ncbi:MAG: TRAP transporter small permease [Moorellaceae bacterium]
MVQRIIDFLDCVVENSCKVMLVAQTLIVTWVVFGRFILKSTPGWGEESALMAMVWFGLLSASIGVREDAHLKIAVLDMILPPKCLKILDWFNWILMAGFALFLIFYGVKLTQLTAMNIMPGLGISSGWLYASVPASGVAIFIQLFNKVRKML